MGGSQSVSRRVGIAGGCEALLCATSVDLCGSVVLKVPELLNHLAFVFSSCDFVDRFVWPEKQERSTNSHEPTRNSLQRMPDMI
jgi:hypothetical protein